VLAVVVELGGLLVLSASVKGLGRECCLEKGILGVTVRAFFSDDICCSFSLLLLRTAFSGLGVVVVVNSDDAPSVIVLEGGAILAATLA